MGRLIEETELEKYIMHDGCEKGCGYIDERDLKYIPTVEAIPKADYENRLKADMVAVLKELKTEIEECIEDTENYSDYNAGLKQGIYAIQQKINALKDNSHE